MIVILGRVEHDHVYQGFKDHFIDTPLGLHRN